MTLFFQTNISRFGSKNLVDDCNLIYDKFKKKKKFEFITNILDEIDLKKRGSI